MRVGTEEKQKKNSVVSNILVLCNNHGSCLLLRQRVAVLPMLATGSVNGTFKARMRVATLIISSGETQIPWSWYYTLSYIDRL